MVDLLPRGRVPYIITLAGVLVTLLLPMYGPWLDPTFVGRQPFHNHIYLGEVDTEHHHPTSKHDHKIEESDKDCTPVLSDVISLPDGGVLQQLLMLWQPFPKLTVWSDDNSLSFHWQPDDRFVLAIFLTPPRRPPRDCFFAPIPHK